MNGTRVILITASGPSGQVDLGVRSDATPAELVMSLRSVLGVGLGGATAEHYAPPRPGVPRGTRLRIDVDIPLADSSVADGDVIIFRNQAPMSATQGAGPDEPHNRD